jgi:multiple sugar transport system permease protein/raffinose/stachyose/melibiose transport system permease protein
MIPQVSTLIPLYITMEKIGLVNTRVGLSLSHQLLVIPFAVWMIRGFIVSIPKSLEESAMIDGCSRIGTILRIIIPVGASGIFATSLYIWILAWEEFPYALTFINTSALRTISVGIDQFSSEYQVDWGSVMTTSLLMTLPIVTMFYLIQDKFIKGIVEGALKE